MRMGTENRGPSPASEHAAGLRDFTTRRRLLALVDRMEVARMLRQLDAADCDERERDRRRAEAQRR